MRYPSPDGQATWQLVQDLRALKLSPAARAFVKAVEAKLQVGVVPHKDDQKLRKLYRAHGQQLADLLEARERGRESMAREKYGITRSEIEKAVAERVAEETERKSDLGI